MPMCETGQCLCGHMRDMHTKAGTCAHRTCSCVQFVQCQASDMFVMKGRKGFDFVITGRGMCPEDMDLQQVKTYIQGILAHADQNNMNNFDYPFSEKSDKKKGKNFIFDMLTRIQDYEE